MTPINIIINVLDDDDIILEFIQDIFSDDPIYQVNTFTNPIAFKKAFYAQYTHLIITDVRVPGYDLHETLKEFNKQNPGCYIIVISGYVDTKDFLLPLFPLGVSYVIEKEANTLWFKKLRAAADELKPKMLLKAKYQ